MVGLASEWNGRFNFSNGRDGVWNGRLFLALVRFSQHWSASYRYKLLIHTFTSVYRKKEKGVTQEKPEAVNKITVKKDKQVDVLEDRRGVREAERRGGTMHRERHIAVMRGGDNCLIIGFGFHSWHPLF
jgi:urease gamma subunit